MFQAPPRERPWVSWLALLAWAGVIFCAIPFARRAQYWLASHWGVEILRWFAIAVIVVAAAIAAVYLWRRLSGQPWRNVAWLAATVGIFVYLSLEKMKTPGEAIHFLEYGFLGLLAFRAMSHYLRDGLIYICAFLLCTLVGTADEILQWLTPGRYWDVRDIGHNAVAAGLAQLTLARGMRPPFIDGFGAPRSVRWFCALAATQLVVLGLCASNTPVAVARISERIKPLAFLLQNDSPMSEYGFRHTDPDIGRFYSRFGLDDLQWLDGRRGAEAGPVLRHYLTENSYSNFLARYTPAVDPFIHEAMVHLYRRNHYHAVVWKYREDSKLYRLHATVAYRENEILEKYFPRTLAAAGERWPSGRGEELLPHLRADRVYKSEVSKHLITEVSERQVWTIILVLLGLDLVLLLAFGRERSAGGGGTGDAAPAAPHA